MVHRVHGCLGEAELGDELLDGVRLDDAVPVRVVVPGRDELRLVGEVLAVGVVGLAPRASVGRAVGAPDAVASVLRQVHDGRTRHAAQHVLVHEALAVLVHHKARVRGVGVVGRQVGASEHDGVGGLLPGGAHPQLHLLPLAVVDSVGHEAGVVVDLGVEVAQTHDLGGKAGHHVAVVREVASRHDDGLGALVLDVAAVLVLGDHRRHSAGRVVVAADKLEGLRLEVNLHAQVLGQKTGQLIGDVGLTRANGTVELGVVRIEGVCAGGGVHDVVGCVLGAALHRHLEAGGRGLVDEPVHGLFGVVVVLVPETGLEVAVVHHVLSAVPVGVHLGQAHLLHHLGVHRVVRSTARDGGLGGAHDDDGEAALGGGDGGDHARHATAYDDDIGGLRLCDLVLCDGVRSNLERPLSVRRGDLGGSVLGLGRDGGDGGACGSRYGGAGDKGTTGQLRIHDKLLFSEGRVCARALPTRPAPGTPGRR